MALSNTTQFQDFVSRMFWAMDKVYGGIDRYGFWREMGVDHTDFQAQWLAYQTQKPTYEARPTSQELFPNAHGATETVFGTGATPARTKLTTMEG